VVLKVNYEPGTYYIKRVIGLPGETVRIDEEGVIYINGEVLEEHYGKETIDTAHIGRAINEVKLGEGEFFVMGDNRNNSLDSRFEAVGNIKKSDIIGKAVLRMYPFNKFGKVGK
jgi:signal peptidase I